MLFAGAIIGVVADRLWRRIESRYLVEISIGLKETLMPSSDTYAGATVKVRNKGSGRLPPYRVLLGHSGMTFDVFENSQEPLGLEPEQEATHFLVLLVNHSPVRQITDPWLALPESASSRRSDRTSYYLELRLDRSDRVIASDATLGRTLVELARRIVQARRIQDVGRHLDQNRSIMKDMHYSPNSLFSFRFWRSLFPRKR